MGSGHRTISPKDAGCASMPLGWARRLLASLLVACLTLASIPPAALAKSSVPSFVKVASGSKPSIVKTTAKERVAYRRAYKACLDYKRQPKTIVVDVSDLKLTDAQALHVGYLLHANGELFWVSTYNDDNFTSERFVLPCTYDDATITKMRKKLDKVVDKALSRITSRMDGVTKVHTLHDYLIDRADYADAHKTAYDALVLRKADCFGFAQGMDLLLRRAGFSVDMAFNFSGDHAWNLVKVSGTWYHVDATWDNGYTNAYFWKNEHCHLFLLQSDAVMTSDGYTDEGHGRWWAHHRCTSKKYRDEGYARKEPFNKECTTYKLYTKGFTRYGLRYKVYGTGKVRLTGVSSSAKKKARTLTVPAKVTYKGKTYKVVGIARSALAGTKAKTLVVESGRFSKARVKGSLAGSKVTRIRLAGAAAKKRAAYKKYFVKANSGRKVKVR